MADNVTITPGSGTTVRTDDVGGVQYPVVKLDWGGDGVTVAATGDQVNGLDVDVTRVQGSVTVISGTAANLKVDASGVAVPITDNAGSITIDASSLPLPTGAATETTLAAILVDVARIPTTPAGEHTAANSPHAARLTDGATFYNTSTAAQLPAALVSGRLDVNVGAASAVPVTDNAGSITVDAPVATPVFVRLSDGAAPLTALPVTDNAGLLSVDDGGGSLTVDGTVLVNQANAGTVGAAWFTKVSDGTNVVDVSHVGGAYGLKVDVIQAAGIAQADKSGFTEGTSTAAPVGGVYNETISSDPTEDQMAALRITARRGLHVNLRSAAGVEQGTAGAPVRVDPTGSTAQPVSGTVTVYQGGAGATAWPVAVTGIGQNVTAIAGTGTGIQKVGVVDEAGVAFSETNPVPVRSTYPEQTRFKNAVTYSASQTAIAIFTPTGGKRYVLCNLTITPTGTGSVKVFDNTDAATNQHYQGTVNGTAPAPSIVMQFNPPCPSEAINQVLRYSTGGGATGDITVYGYEV